MATEEQRRMLQRRAESGVSSPILEMPKMPERFKRRMEDKAAWEQYEAEMDRWRKTLAGGSTSRLIGSSQGGGSGGGSGGGTGSGGAPPIVIPPVEEDLHAVYLMELLWG